MRFDVHIRAFGGSGRAGPQSFTWLGTARGHGIAQGTVEVDGDFLILSGEKIHTSRCRDPKEVGWGAL